MNGKPLALAWSNASNDMENSIPTNKSNTLSIETLVKNIQGAHSGKAIGL